MMLLTLDVQVMFWGGTAARRGVAFGAISCSYCPASCSVHVPRCGGVRVARRSDVRVARRSDVRVAGNPRWRPCYVNIDVEHVARVVLGRQTQLGHRHQVRHIVAHTANVLGNMSCHAILISRDASANLAALAVGRRLEVAGELQRGCCSFSVRGRHRLRESLVLQTLYESLYEYLNKPN
jgi:hypothetical protein